MEPLGEDVRRELGRFGPQARIAEAVEAWPAAVGPEIAANAWPARFQRDGTLVVHTRDAVWGYELTQQAAEVAARLPDSPPLSFVPGPLPDPAPPPPPRHTPRPPLPEQVAAAEAWAAAIEDGELREIVARAARASLARAAADRPF